MSNLGGDRGHNASHSSLHNASVDAAIGRRIINQPAHDSRLIATGRSGLDPEFNDRTGFVTFKQDFDHYGGGAKTSNSLAGGFGGVRASQESAADRFSGLGHQAANIARHQGDATPHKSSLRRDGHHQASAQSISVISTDTKGRATHKASSNKIEDSTAALDRPPTRVQGLTDFLRREYYRRMGIYLNGGRGEDKMLINYWKDYVSETYRQLREREKEQLKIENKHRKMMELAELEERDAAAARRIKHDMEEKRKKKEEEIIRQQNIAAKSTTNFNKSVSKRPQSGAARAMTSTMTSAKRTSSAVPEIVVSKDSVQYQYEQFKSLFEEDVVFTVVKDLEDQNKEEVKHELGYEAKLNAKAIRQKDQVEAEIVERMLELYFFGPFENNESMKSTKSTTKNETKPPRQPILGDQAPSPEHLTPEKERVSMKQLMKNDLAERIRTERLQWRASKPKDQQTDFTFFNKLFTFVRATGDKTMSNDPEVAIRAYQAHNSEFDSIIGGSKDRVYTDKIYEFFNAVNFVKRVYLHQFHICVSKTKRKNLITLYYHEITQSERMINLIDYVPSKKGDKVNNGGKVLRDHLSQQKQVALSEEEKARKAAHDKREAKLMKQAKDKKTEKEGLSKQAEELSKSEAEKILQAERKEANAKRIAELAKPLDKQRAGKQLLKLQQTFKHDRVLERMIKNEFKSNQPFRYPEEYDKFSHSEDMALKVEPEIEDYKSVRTRVINEDPFTKGEIQTKRFNQADTLKRAEMSGKNSLVRSQDKKLEADLIMMARAYIKQSEKRLSGQSEDAENIPAQKAFAEIYSRLRDGFKVEDGSKEAQIFEAVLGSKGFEAIPSIDGKRNFPGHAEAMKLKFPMVTHGMKEDSEAYKKTFPQSFKRYFQRLIKTLCSKKAVKTLTDNRSVLKHFKKMPTTFMVTGLAGTFNKKIQETRDFTQFKQKTMCKERRSRVFYRPDYAKAREQIFMTYDEMVNCRFEPNTGSLNPHYKPPQNTGAEEEGPFTEEKFKKKMGKNLLATHPDVYKTGVYKRAKLLFDKGAFDQALAMLGNGFHIDSLKDKFDPEWKQRAKARQTREQELNAAKHKKNNELAELDGMKETTADQQNKNEMVRENFEQAKKSGLYKILEQAYELIHSIEKRQEDADKKIEALKEKKKKLYETQSEIKNRSTMMEDLLNGPQVLYKTIMCPLGQRCPKHNAMRWPQSSEKTTKPLGAYCPYAHHANELQFTETLAFSISACDKRATIEKNSVASNTIKKAFVPASKLVDCKGAANSSCKCNMCLYRVANKAYENKVKAARQRSKSKGERGKSVGAQDEEQEALQELRAIKTKLDLDDSYWKKFGFLKKASVLKFYNRDKDAKKAIADAAVIVQEEKKSDQEIMEAIQKRWRFKLSLDPGFEIPASEKVNIKTMHPKEIKDSDLAALDIAQQVPVATIRLYIDKTSPFNLNNYSKHVFLNDCIERLYHEIESVRVDKFDNITRMRKTVDFLDNVKGLREEQGPDAVIEFDLDEDKADLEEEAHRKIKIKPPKTEMCESILKKEKKQIGIRKANPKCKIPERPLFERKVEPVHGKCGKPKGECQSAHNPMQLELVELDKKIKNLKSVIGLQQTGLQHSKTTTSWIPANSNSEPDKSVFEPYIESKPAVDVEDADLNETGKVKSIYKREDLYKDPFEDQE